MCGMKHLLFLSLACGSALCAVSAPAIAAPASAEQSVEARLSAELQSLVKNNSEDFYGAAALVYDATKDVTAFPPLMKKLAEAGNPAALLWLARYHAMQSGGGAQALALLEKAAASKYLPAMVEFAAKCTLPNSPAAQAAKGRKVLMEACRLGSAKGRALYLVVSGRFQNGSINQPEIVSELKKNNFYLEEMIAAFQVEPTSALVWLERAAEHGSPVAPFLIWSNNPMGEKAPTYMQMALERHLPAALGHVGYRDVLSETLQEDGGDATKAAAALRMLAISAMLNTPDSIQMLAYFYANGQGGAVPKERIAELFRLSHLCGHPDGTAGLGYCMVLGAGCKQNVQGGMELMQQAAANGAKWVHQAFASMYFNGDGVEPDMRKAIDAFAEDHLNRVQSGAGARHSYAMMAVITALGNASAKPDPRAAKVYLNMALEQGDADAENLYNLFLNDGKWRFLEELLR